MPPPHILFYSSTPRAFRTTLIGYLAQLSRAYRVTLLSEDLDQECDAVLESRDFFPGLERRIRIAQYSGPGQLCPQEHRRLAGAAQEAVRDIRPAAVFSSSDMDSVFELYLMRAAWASGAATVSMQATLTMEMPRTARWISYSAAELLPKALPEPVRRSIVFARKAAGHAAVYWALPLYSGEAPFTGYSSHILNRGHSAMRDAQAHTTFNDSQAAKHRASGTPSERLCVIPHPIAVEKRLFDTAFRHEMPGSGVKRALILYPWERNGFTERGGTLPQKEYLAVRRALVDAAAEELRGWEVLVKPHPMVSDLASVRSDCPAMRIIPPSDPLDRWAAGADAIIELPRAASTASFVLAQQRQDRPVLALDLHNEFLGDVHKESPGVDYITSMDSYRSALRAVRDGSPRQSPPASRCDCADMATFAAKLVT